MKQKFEKLSDGTEAALLAPQLDAPLAIVDIRVIKKLADLLQGADLSNIIGKFSDELMAMVDREFPATIDEYVEALSEELSFHKSVNLITEYKVKEPSTGQLTENIF